MRDPLAFEYVSGTLRGAERSKFAARLAADEQLSEDVRFWEEQLMALSPDERREPEPDTWDKISARITASTPPQGTESRSGSWRSFWQWATPSVAALGLMLVLFGYYPKTLVQGPNTDYVAVLTGESGEAMLTALTAENGKNMWLKWNINNLTPDTHAQLWAISKRDGETRPITVLESTSIDSIDLDEAAWRLITDAAYLVLTEEELGGSPFDEPSDILLAKGVCVRFSPQQNTI